MARWRHVLITDAKTGYDVIQSESSPTDRKIAIDVGVLCEAMLEHGTSCMIRWVPGSDMPGDGLTCLTKWAHDHVLTRLMEQGEWSLTDTAAAQALRRWAAAKRSVWRKQQKDQRTVTFSRRGLCESTHAPAVTV